MNDSRMRATGGSRGRWAALVTKLASIASAGMAAVIPLGILSGAGSLYSDVAVGRLAIALSVAAYIAQVAGAVSVEAPLLGHSGRHVNVPTAWYVAGLVGSAVWIIAQGRPGIAMIGLFLMIPSLECARAAAVLQGGWRRELLVGGVLVAGVALVLVVHRPIALHLGIGLAVAIAILIRMPLHWYRFEGIHGNQWWVVAETAIVGLVQPLALNIAYDGLGPTSATGLKFAMSVTNIMSPVLYYLRIRLLNRHSRADLALSVALIGSLAVAIVVCQQVGLFRVVLGRGWGSVTMAMLLLTVVWKLVSLVSTIPFTALRRLGRGGAVLGVRVATTCTYVGSVLVSVHLHPSTAAVLVAFTVSEAISLMLFTAVYRRVSGSES